MLFNTVNRPLDIILWFVLLSALAGCESAPVPERQDAAGSDRNILFELGGGGRVVDGTSSRLDGAGKDFVVSNTADSLYTLEEGGDSLWVLATAAPVEPIGEKASRAAQSQTLADAGSFTVWSWMWQKANTANSYYYIAGTEVLEESGGIWAPLKEYPWPGKAYEMVFYAVAPHGVVTTMARTTTARTSFTYTVKPDPADQPDLMAAYTATAIPGDNGAPADLTFNHILSAIKVVTGDDFQTSTVSSVKFKGIKSKGEYVYGSGWTDITDPVTYEVQPDKSVPSTPGSAIIDGASTLMLMPQQLAGAEIEITLTDANSGVTRTLSTTLTGDWLPGYVYTYRVSTTQIVKEVTLSAKVPEWDYTGAVANGQTRLEITSIYRWKDGSGYLTPSASEPWTAQWVDDQGNAATAPTWLRNTPTSGTGGTQTYAVTCTKQTNQINGNVHDDILKNAIPVTGAYDLSTKGGTAPRNTANCYIVNAPGTYLIPLVYGNAIKDGATNSSAYSGLTGNPANLINHLGNAITDPWIANNTGCIPSTASLVWQDTKGLIKVNSSLVQVSGGRAIKFTIAAEDIRQGNAIIAVKNSSGVILWSWHIWVTDYVPGLSANNKIDSRDKTVASYTWMPIYLGWVYGDNIYYPARTAILRVTSPTGTYHDIIFDSDYGQGKINGHAALWQWGRKDPMIPTNVNNTDYPCYDGNGTTVSFKQEKFAKKNASSVVSYSIQHPDIFNDNQATHMSGYGAVNAYNNLWGGKNGTYFANTCGKAPEYPTKTVYDPCPAGYVIPSYTQVYNSFHTTFTEDQNIMSLVCTVGEVKMWFPRIGFRQCWGSSGDKYGQTTGYGTHVFIISNAAGANESGVSSDRNYWFGGVMKAAGTWPQNYSWKGQAVPVKPVRE